MGKLLKKSKRSNRLAQLKALRVRLAEAIDDCESMRDLPALTKQYRETIKEIEEIEGTIDDGDEISKILQERDADGLASPVR